MIKKYNEFLNEETSKKYQEGSYKRENEDIQAECDEVIDTRKSNLGQGVEPYKLCTIGNELFLTRDYYVIIPKNNFKELIDDFLNGTLSSKSFKEEINEFADVYEWYLSYIV